MKKSGIVLRAMLLGIVVMLAWPRDSSAEYYSSIDSMEKLGNYEMELIDVYRQYLAALQEDLNKYRKFVEHVRIQLQMVQEDAEDYLGNSINAFTTIKRNVVDWGQLKDLIKETHLRDNLSEVLDDLNEETPLPDYDEVRGAVRGLARLQQMYNLNATDLASGEINEIYYASELSPRDCFEIATNLFEDKNYPLAASWFEEVLKILNEKEKKQEESIAESGGESDANNKAKGDSTAEGKSEEKPKSDEAEFEDGKVEDVVEAVFERIQDNKPNQEDVTPVNYFGEEEGDDLTEYEVDDDNEGDGRLQGANSKGNSADYEDEDVEDETEKAQPENKRKSVDPESEDGKVENVVEDVFEGIQDNKPNQEDEGEEEGDDLTEYEVDDDNEGDGRLQGANSKGNAADYEDEEVEDETEKAQPENKRKSVDPESEDGKVEEVVEDSYDRNREKQPPINAEQEDDEGVEYDDDDGGEFEPIKSEETVSGAPEQIAYEPQVDNEYADYKYEQSASLNDKLEIESLEYLALANYRMGRVQVMISYIEELLKIVPHHKYIHMINYVLSINATTTNQAPVYEPIVYTNYSRLCQGKQQPEKILHKLKCKLETKNNPVFTLAPLKTEELSLDPAVMVYHNLLSDSLIASIREESSGTMYRSMVRSKKGGAVTEIRVSQQTWLDYTSPSMQLVYRIASDVTGFDLSNAETMQLANYGIGGQYDPHHDYFEEDHDEPQWVGNRIATCMFYLSEVEQGGYTVFPKINVYSAPVKGSMVMWHNLHKSLDRDVRTLHAGCPVIKGTKRIGNIWTHSGYQEFRRPCALERDNYKSFGYA